MGQGLWNCLLKFVLNVDSAELFFYHSSNLKSWLARKREWFKFGFFFIAARLPYSNTDDKPDAGNNNNKASANVQAFKENCRWCLDDVMCQMIVHAAQAGCLIVSKSQVARDVANRPGIETMHPRCSACYLRLYISTYTSLFFPGYCFIQFVTSF